MDHLEDGTAWGVVANSGNANACCPLSHENAQASAAAAQPPAASQRTLWWPPPESSENDQHRCDSGRYAERQPPLWVGTAPTAANAIMTTDTAKKRDCDFFELQGGKEVDGGYRQGLRHDSSEHGAPCWPLSPLTAPLPTNFYPMLAPGGSENL